MGHICRGIFIKFHVARTKGRTKDGITNDWRHLKENWNRCSRAHFLNAICIENVSLNKIKFCHH